MQTTASQTFEENRHIAACLREAAQRLADQGANPYRVAAYRASAETVDALDLDIRSLFESGGVDALGMLPEVGTGVAQAIAELLVTGAGASSTGCAATPSAPPRSKRCRASATRSRCAFTTCCTSIRSRNSNARPATASSKRSRASAAARGRHPRRAR